MEMNDELRLYTFTNFYLSSIQQGIQPAHAQNELMMAALVKVTSKRYSNQSSEIKNAAAFYKQIQ